MLANVVYHEPYVVSFDDIRGGLVVTKNANRRIISTIANVS